MIELEPHYRVSLKFWDTGGQERYHALIPAFSRDLDVACVLYDVSLPNNAASVRRTVRSLLASLVPRDRRPALLLVGNMLDMLVVDEDETRAEEHVCGTREAWHEALGDEIVGAFASLECVLVSAKSGHNVWRLEEMVYARGRELARSLIPNYAATGARPEHHTTVELDATPTADAVCAC